MISFKQYKLLHENLSTFTLGVKTPQGIGVSEAPMLGAMMRKKMHGGVPHDEEDMMKKKPPMGGDMGDDEEGSPEDDMGTADDTDIDEPSDEETPDMGDEGEGEDMGDETPDMGDESPDMGGEGEAEGPPMKGPMKKKMPPAPPSPMMMKKMGYMKKEQMDHDEDEDEEDHKHDKKGRDIDDEEEDEEMTMKNPTCCKKCKKCNKMKKEENEFLNSLKRQCGASKFAPDELGFWGPVQEDALLAPSNNSEEKSEPGPGEIGYAPTQKVGSIGSFQEWASKHKKKKK